MPRLTPVAVIRRKAQALLSDRRVQGPPVKLDAIAKKLGITIKHEPFDDDISGVLYRDPNSTIIGVNSFHHPNRQRVHFGTRDWPFCAARNGCTCRQRVSNCFAQFCFFSSGRST